MLLLLLFLWLRHGGQAAATAAGRSARLRRVLHRYATAPCLARGQLRQQRRARRRGRRGTGRTAAAAATTGCSAAGRAKLKRLAGQGLGLGQRVWAARLGALRGWEA